MEGPAIAGVVGESVGGRSLWGGVPNSRAKHSQAGPMSSVRYVGLDVHKATVAVAESGSAPAEGLGSWDHPAIRQKPLH